MIPEVGGSFTSRGLAALALLTAAAGPPAIHGAGYRIEGDTIVASALAPITIGARQLPQIEITGNRFVVATYIPSQAASVAHAYDAAAPTLRSRVTTPNIYSVYPLPA